MNLQEPPRGSGLRARPDRSGESARACGIAAIQQVVVALVGSLLVPSGMDPALGLIPVLAVLVHWPMAAVICWRRGRDPSRLDLLMLMCGHWVIGFTLTAMVAIGKAIVG